MNAYSTALLRYSITRGGWFYQLQRRLRLLDADVWRVASRAVIFALLAWLPIAILAGVQGNAFGPDPGGAFFFDYVVYARLLLGVPLLIVAENVIENRYVIIASYFLDSGLVTDEQRGTYLDLLGSAQRLVTSPRAETGLLVLAYLITAASALYGAHNDSAASWVRGDHATLSPAGIWFLGFSLPLFQFLVLRWVWRFFVWCRSLWRLSGMKLKLVSTHPDSVAGLGILSESLNAYSPIFFALSAVVSAVWCKRIVYGGESASDYHRPFLIFLSTALLVAIVPLTLFTRRLVEIKLRGLHDYGILADHHSTLFERKWIEEIRKTDQSILGTPDISSLADLTVDYQTVQGMKFVPFRAQNVLYLVLAVSTPMFPLLLTEIPLRDLVVKIGGALF